MRKYIFYIILSALLAVNLFFSFQAWHNQIKVGYVNLNLLYDGFKMKKELEGKLKSLEHKQEEEVKKLKTDLSSKPLKDNDAIAAQKQFEQKVQEIQESDNKMVNDIRTQIFKQLDLYIKEYRQTHEEDILLGADGSGSVMAADSSLDRTAAVLVFVNKRYDGLSGN